jgi:hypothetical protein
MLRQAWLVPAAIAACLVAASPAVSDDLTSGDDAAYVQDDAVASTLDPGVAEAYDEEDADADAAAEASSTGGAVQKHVFCTVQGRPFRQTLRISGRLVVTPSGNQTLVCHGRANAKVLRGPVDQAIVIHDGACTVPPRRITKESQLVVTPSFHVTLVCHIHPDATP